MFWWYWSPRRRLLLLAAVVFPVVSLLAFRILFAADPSPRDVPAAADAPAGAPADPLETAAASPVEGVLVLAGDESQSAANEFPETFGDFGDGAVDTRNLVFPGQPADAFSLYLYYSDVPGNAPTTDIDGSSPAVTTTTQQRPGSTESDPGTLLGRVREELRWRFVAFGAVVSDVVTRSGTEMLVVGTESGRGFRATLRFLEVPSGVVVTGLVVEIPANEAADAVESAKAEASEDPLSPSGTPSTVVSPTTSVVSPAVTSAAPATLPSSPSTTVDRER